MSSKAEAYEKLGAFYLGRPYDSETGETEPAPLLYDSKDLQTHAVCVGMTGSGKTGLCISLLEEAAIDGIPALVIDVKGDLGNLLLTFPDLDSADFRPWIDEAEADRKGMGPDEFAKHQAKLWKKGLAGWDQDGDRIQRLKDAAEFAIYTPGSEAGLPISILSSFAAPPPEIANDNDLLRERIATTAASLLGLLGLDVDPIRSRESIYLSNLLDHAWRQGDDLDLGALIQLIQDPPFERVGVMAVDSFYPAKDRFELAMSLNNLLASPSFQSWMSGEPLSVDRLLYNESGKPRIAILSIAHLSDTERMFFVSLLLDQALGWMRTRSGTSSLRALLYMDEIFGYLPPVANPPSKRPLLTLLKQARAFGFGMLLATQNPVDLDYKALSNIGTWFLGRLQTERDKERVIDGLLGASGDLDRGDLERILSGVGKRIFLLHNVHEDAPVLFKVRWAMSYLRGPLTRSQIKELTAEAKSAAPADDTASARLVPSRKKASVSPRPVLPPGIPQCFLPLSGSPRDVRYQPHLIGLAKVHFIDARKGLEAAEEIALSLPLDEDTRVDWYEAQEVDLHEDQLEDDPADDDLGFDELPEAATEKKSFTAWRRALADMLYRSRRYKLLRSKTFDVVSQPGESERSFRIRLSDVAHEKRDADTDKLRKRYAGKMATLEGRILRAEQKVVKEQEQAKQKKYESVISVGTTLLGALLGRKKVSATNLRRAGSAFRGVGRLAKEKQDVEHAEEQLLALQQQMQDLNAELEQEVEELASRFAQDLEELDTLALKPRKTDIDVRVMALAWVPFRENRDGDLEPAWD
ncbi:MAG: DUF87 domain-containing protein [Acidobacteriota bacterium]